MKFQIKYSRVLRIPSNISAGFYGKIVTNFLFAKKFHLWHSPKYTAKIGKKILKKQLVNSLFIESEMFLFFLFKSVLKVLEIFEAFKRSYLKEVATIQRSLAFPSANGSDFKRYEVSSYEITPSKRTFLTASGQQLLQKFMMEFI